MTIKQISIFIENKPETLSELTDVLAKNNVNMRAIMLADTSDFGVVRLLIIQMKLQNFWKKMIM